MEMGKDAMTIFLMTGTPGSGKSLHMASMIRWSMRVGRPVVVNFEVNKGRLTGAKVKQVETMDLNPEMLTEYARDYFKETRKPIKEGAIQLFIDEAALIFNARSWNDKDRKEWVSFFQLHRKLGYNVYIISQFDEMIDKQIRALCEYEIKHRVLNAAGWVGAVSNVLLLGHPLVCAVTYWYGQKMRLSAEWILGTKGLYRMYDTFKVFG